MALIAPAKPAVRVIVRDPKRTRERILAAALKEFAAKGLAGARVARIARRARINKRMLYHYFGDKEDLYREILGRKLRERVAWMATAPDDPGEGLTFWLAIACRDRDWVRFLEWEALSAGDSPVIRERERRRAVEQAIGRLQMQQTAGLVAPDLDPRQLLLSMSALTTFPVAFPQITRLITGRAPGDRAFQRNWGMFLRRFAQFLKSERSNGASAGRGRHAGGA
jgi:TetR/AcrR family transcriptional regulator